MKIVKYVIFGVGLYAIEDSNGRIFRYCGSRKRAEQVLKEV